MSDQPLDSSLKEDHYVTWNSNLRLIALNKDHQDSGNIE